jgi:hypothetical protein
MGAAKTDEAAGRAVSAACDFSGVKAISTPEMMVMVTFFMRSSVGDQQRSSDSQSSLFFEMNIVNIWNPKLFGRGQFSPNEALRHAMTSTMNKPLAASGSETSATMSGRHANRIGTSFAMLTVSGWQSRLDDEIAVVS